MGSGFSTIQDNISCQFDKKYTMIYKTGELVSGKMTFLNDGQIELKLKNIIIELVGEIVYYSTRGSGAARSTDIHVRPFLTERHTLRSANNNDSFLLESGEHTWPFSFRLEDNLPSTLEQTRHNGPYIRYLVRIHFVQSEWYKKNIQKVSSILVQYHSIPMSSCECKDENQNNKNVHLHAILHENIVIPGEKCSLSIDLSNPQRRIITRISMTLIQYRQLGDAGNDEVILFKKNLNGIDDFRDERWQNTFNIQIPDRIVSSCSCIPPQWSSRKALVVRYELHLEAHVHGLGMNVHVRLPFTVTHIKQNKIHEDPLPPRYEKLFLL